MQIEEEHLLGDVIKLESAIKYREEDMNNARILVDQYPPDDPDTEMNLACLDYKVLVISPWACLSLEKKPVCSLQYTHDKCRTSGVMI